MKKRILIIEDEAAVASYLGVFLEQAGYFVQRAGDLRSGREHLGRDPFDLILLDVMLPDGTADEILPHLRQLAPNSPILIVTGLASDDDRLVNCLKRGAAGYIPKDSRVEELLTSIRRALRE